MPDKIKPLLPMTDKALSAAVFMSGTGTNAEVLLKNPSENYSIKLIVTDAPLTSRAAELSRTYNVPMVSSDIRMFYRRHGLESISLATEDGRRVRELWTEELRKLIAPYAVDFGILAGFMTMSNITADFPCLNVHPGDLTLTDGEKRRILAGLHIRPVEKALCMGLESLRSSVILATPFSGNGKADMDAGYILGISPCVPVELDGYTATELCAVRDRRVNGRAPKEGDILSSLALKNIEKLKIYGDHVVFPRSIEAFAAGCYGDFDGQLFFRNSPDGVFEKIETVEFGSDNFSPVK